MATFARGYWTRKTNTRNESLRKELNNHAQTTPGKITWLVTAGNEHTLRGIPAIGRGVAGHIRDTNPATALDDQGNPRTSLCVTHG